MTTLLSSQENPVGCDWTVYTFPNGNKASEGCLINGKPEGIWMNYHTNGKIKSQGNRIDHELSGEWLFFDSVGIKIQSVEYVQGIKQGWERTYAGTNENFVIQETPFEGNLKSGLGNEFDENGLLKKSIFYKENLEDGLGKEYAEDGRIISILEFQKGYLRSVQKVNRKDEQGQRNGLWKTWNNRGILREEGYWSNGVRNGIFKFYKTSGELDYLEKYEWGNLVLDSEETAPVDVRKTYHSNGKIASSSTYSNGVKVGIYREYNQEGAVISGAIFDDDSIIARGITTPQGSKEGTWKHYYPGGELHFEGSYENGLKEGEWKYFAITGELIQRGLYRGGKFHNAWQWYYLDGKVHRKEHYRKGKEDGLFEEWDKTGKQILRGEYESGRRQGEWIQDVNDHKEVGSYLDGEKNGIWIHTYPNGKEQFKGEYTLGVPEGKHTYRSFTGNIQRIERYLGGQKNGKWIYYGPSQSTQQSLEYKDDALIRIDGQKVKIKQPKSTEANRKS
jgi:antitoxin component YwqK of YwqJK toxin-antitoxin module